MRNQYVTECECKEDAKRQNEMGLRAYAIAAIFDYDDY